MLFSVFLYTLTKLYSNNVCVWTKDIIIVFFR